MSKTVVGIIAFIVGILGGVFLAAPLVGGTMAGVGAGVGIATGICSTAQAAQELGYLTPEQLDEVLNKAAMDVSGKTEIPEGEEVANSAAACEKVMAELAKSKEG
ncbi:hypothetical protein [Qipengyuania gaetbuli]|uniref:hypothetical protein n=1 Tax=Qipengyuania gaetbuli TaxID=266952 RepID=UPI001CFE70DF|nr:hypothetical protein [Qipengyuania gaetbuli]